jgi:hypothetical protein
MISSIIRLYYSVELTKSNDITWYIEPVAVSNSTIVTFSKKRAMTDP